MPTPVEEIKERLNIVDVVQEYVSLKKAGANHKARCPFHNEKTPSFMVSEPKQMFHCFGCGKGGDLFTFVQEIESIEFAEALRILAQKANVELRPTNPREHNEKTRLLDCLKEANSFFQAQLQNAQEAENARRYITDRGIQKETVELFQIGYSLDSWDALMNHLKKNGYKEKEIERSGLIVPSEKTGGYYDRFRGRLLFPIHNAHGNIIGFGGRTLNPEEKEAKYINSPQTPVYNKSAVLYGLHLAKKYIQKMDATVIVEGYTDVITAYQAKFRNVVSASGTALTEEQVRLLKRYSANVILAFDADTAGLSAAWRGMQLAIQQGMNIKVLILPPGQDPDDLIKKDPQEFRDRAVNAKPFMEYAFDSVLEPLDLTNVHHKKKAAQELLPMLALFPDRIEQTHYVKKLAEVLDVTPDVLQEKIGSMNKKQQKSQARGSKGDATETPQKTVKPNREYMTVERLLALITVKPDEFTAIAEKVRSDTIHDPELQDLYKKIESHYNQAGTFSPDAVEFESSQLSSKWQQLQLIGEELYSERETREIQQELLTLLESLERFRIQRQLKKIEQDLATAEQSNDNATIEQLSEEFRVLTESLRKLG